jgi:hypothetical protein
MHLQQLPPPVARGYGGETLNVRTLYEFSEVSNSNFMLVQGEINTLKLDLHTTRRINQQLTQLLNWIAVTNPQILDEFQTTAHAFDKLVPRDDGGGPYASPQA